MTLVTLLVFGFGVVVGWWLRGFKKVNTAM
jgi:hypothetical protein